MPSPPTKSGTRKLSEVARKVVVPTGIVSTGWPAVRDECKFKLGISFDPWQDGAGRVILAKRADGNLAAMIGGVGMSLPRQVGKTYLIGAIVFALCILNPGMLVIWSAHHARTHGETFLALQAFADRVKVKPYIRQIFTGSGDEEIRFLNGSRILFGARERGFGRGIPGVDMIVSDEAQIMSDKALDAQLATMNTSKFGLAIYVGTPPRPDDPSEAFTRMRTEAWSGELLDAAWIEFGADPNASADDRKQWAKANPSHPLRTPVESILRLQRKLKHESFLREGLGIWDSSDIGSAISPVDWASRIDQGSEMVGAPVFAIDVSPNQSSGAIAAAGYRSDGLPHVEITTADGGKVVDHRDGADWIVPRLIDLDTRWDNLTVNIAAGSAAESLKPEIEALGIGVNLIPAGKVSAACGFIYNKATTGGIKHLGQPQLTTAVAAARKHQEDGETAWKFGRRKSSGDITPLYAATLAVWALVDVDDDHGEVSVYGFNDLDACDGCGDKPHQDPDGDHEYLCIECRDKEN
jgi:hypothetical protein